MEIMHAHMLYISVDISITQYIIGTFY